MKLKKKILIPAAAAALAVSIGASVLTYRAAHPPYNMHPDLSQKPVSINLYNLMADYAVDPNNIDMDMLVEWSDLVVIGTVLDNGTQTWFDRTGGGALREKYDKLYGEGSTMAPATLTKFRIDQLVAGEAPESKMIQIFQLGAPGTLDGQVKLKKGDKMYLMLRDGNPNDSMPIYYSGDVENSMFYLSGNSTLTSMSAIPVCARYDGLPVSKLTDDVKKTKKYKENLGKHTGWVKKGKVISAPAPASSEVSSQPASSAPEPPPAASSGVSSMTASSAVSSASATSRDVSSAPEVSSEAQ